MTEKTKEILTKVKVKLLPFLTLKNVLILLGLFVILYLGWVSYNSPSREQVATLHAQNNLLKKSLKAALSESNATIKALEKKLVESQKAVEKLNKQIESMKVSYEAIKAPEDRAETIKRFNDLGYHPR